MVVSLVTFITNVAGKFYYLFCRMNILHMVWQEMLCTKQLVTNPTLETFVRLIQVIFIVFIFSENIFLFSIFFKFTSTWWLKFYQLNQQKASICKNYIHSSMQRLSAKLSAYMCVLMLYLFAVKKLHPSSVHWNTFPFAMSSSCRWKF